MYASDFDGTWPGTQTSNPQTQWTVLFLPYIKNGQVFRCPSTVRGQSFPVASFISGGDGNTTYYGASTDGGNGSSGTSINSLSYSRNIIPRGGSSGNVRWYTPGFNANGKSGFVGFVSGTTTNTTQPLKETLIEDAVGTIYMVDGMASGTLGSSMAAITNEAETDHFGNAQDSKVAYRHFTGFNALYGDGHVKWNAYGKTTAGQWTIQAND